MSTFVIEPDDDDLSAFIVEAVASEASVAEPKVDGQSDLDAFIAKILALDPLAVEIWLNSPCAATIYSKDSSRSQIEVPLWNAQLNNAQRFYCVHALEEHDVSVRVMWVST